MLEHVINPTLTIQHISVMSNRIKIKNCKAACALSQKLPINMFASISHSIVIPANKAWSLCLHKQSENSRMLRGLQSLHDISQILSDWVTSFLCLTQKKQSPQCMKHCHLSNPVFFNLKLPSVGAFEEGRRICSYGIVCLIRFSFYPFIT